MNQYATTARRHWERWLPQRFQSIPNPTEFFADLGEQVESQIEDLEVKLAGDDPPGEGYLTKVGRLTNARHRAEEIVLREMVLLAPEPSAAEAESTSR